MLEVNNLGCVRGDRRLFSGVSLTMTAGTLVQLTGANGTGKTSLLRMICGLLAPAEGQISWRGTRIQSLGEEYFSSLMYIGHRHGLKEELSSLENLQISSGLSGRPLALEEGRRLLVRMGLAGRENLPTRFLSEGQKKRSALAQLLASETVLWLLDEIFNSLDKSAISLVKELIQEHLQKGGMAIIATHQELDIPASSFQRLELAT